MATGKQKPGSVVNGVGITAAGTRVGVSKGSEAGFAAWQKQAAAAKAAKAAKRKSASKSSSRSSGRSTGGGQRRDGIGRWA